MLSGLISIKACSFTLHNKKRNHLQDTTLCEKHSFKYAKNTKYSKIFRIQQSHNSSLIQCHVFRSLILRYTDRVLSCIQLMHRSTGYAFYRIMSRTGIRITSIVCKLNAAIITITASPFVFS